jgi:hypothetical protein
MTKYDDVIARAVAALPLDPAGRQATYNRARAAMVDRLRSTSPPWPEAAIKAERAALEEAIHRAEMKFSNPSDEILEPAAGLKPDRRLGVRIAIVCCIGIVAALAAGLLTYGYSGGTPQSAYRQLLQWMAQPSERAGPAQAIDATSAEAVPYVYLRQLVHYRSTSPAGTLIIDKAQRHLYVILANVTAIRYGIALGGDCTEAAGPYTVSRKTGASQSPPAPSNLLDDRTLFLDSDTRLIRGTNASKAIGQSIRAGCFLLMPTDMAELYGRIPVGTRVVVN